MKFILTAMNGSRNLRKADDVPGGYTQEEIAVLKYALNSGLASGETFVGVPDSVEERYRTSGKKFTIADISRINGGIVVVSSSSTKHDKLTAVIRVADGGTKPAPKDAPAPEEAENTDDMDEDVECEEITDPQPQPQPQLQMDGNAALGALAAMFGGIEQNVANKVMQTISPQIEAIAKRVQNNAVQIIEVHNGGETHKVEGLIHRQFGRVLNWVTRGRNVYLYGPTGSGKSILAKQIAKALGVELYPDAKVSDPYKITGFANAAGEFVPSNFYNAFVNGGLYFLDEMDSADPEALITLNDALANGWFTFPVVGKVEAHKNFHCIAAGNTVGTGATEEYCGRNQLDAATLGRFVVVSVDYDERVEKGISAGDENAVEYVHTVREIAKQCGLVVDTGYRTLQNIVCLAQYEKDEAKKENRDIISALATLLGECHLAKVGRDELNMIAAKLPSTRNEYLQAFKKYAA